MNKNADVVGTDVMPTQPLPGPYETPKAVVKKAAELGRLVHGTNAPPDGSAPGVEVASYEKPIDQFPQANCMRPHVDVAGKDAKNKLVEKKAQVCALDGRYPLDSYEQVKTASAYFDTYEKFFTPEQRREFCSNLVKQADVMGIKVSEEARSYGANTYTSNYMLKAAIDSRRNLINSETHPEALEVLDKIASWQRAVPPEEYASALVEFDRAMGFDSAHYQQHLIDPYRGTFGIEKSAEWSEMIGDKRVDETSLKQLVSKGLNSVKAVFSCDLVKEFAKDPVGIFKSLPIDQRKIIVNMASEIGTEPTQPA